VAIATLCCSFCIVSRIVFFSIFLLVTFFFFFFSSRRRHTRFSRDWSSDVCSSDLAALSEPWALGLAAGALLVFAVAFTDDRTPIRARWRFIAQGAAVAAAVVGGTWIATLGELLWARELRLPLLLAVPFTLFGVCGDRKSTRL